MRTKEYWFISDANLFDGQIIYANSYKQATDKLKLMLTDKEYNSAELDGVWEIN